MPSTRTPADLRSALRQSFKAYWDASGLSPLPSVVYDNKDFPADGAEYVHLNIAHVSGTIPALGNDKYRRSGVLVVNIWAQEGKGMSRADELAEAALGWLETLELAGVRFRDPGLTESGASGGYWQGAASARFEYDTIRT